MQFGGALQHILKLVHHANPQYGPMHLSKHDIKDGYYHLFLRPEDCLCLAIILPAYDDEDQLVAIPMACTMGWIESPPTFCTMSETVADETNRRTVENPDMAAPHRLEEAAAVADEHHGLRLVQEAAPRTNLPRPQGHTHSGSLPPAITSERPPRLADRPRPLQLHLQSPPHPWRSSGAKRNRRGPHRKIFNLALSTRKVPAALSSLILVGKRSR